MKNKVKECEIIAKMMMGHCKGVIFMKMKKNLKLWKMKNRNLVDEFEDFGMNV